MHVVQGQYLTTGSNSRVDPSRPRCGGLWVALAAAFERLSSVPPLPSGRACGVTCDRGGTHYTPTRSGAGRAAAVVLSAPSRPGWTGRLGWTADCVWLNCVIDDCEWWLKYTHGGILGKCKKVGHVAYESMHLDETNALRPFPILYLLAFTTNGDKVVVNLRWPQMWPFEGSEMKNLAWIIDEWMSIFLHI